MAEVRPEPHRCEAVRECRRAPCGHRRFLRLSLWTTSCPQQSQLARLRLWMREMQGHLTERLRSVFHRRPQLRITGLPRRHRECGSGRRTLRVSAAKVCCASPCRSLNITSRTEGCECFERARQAPSRDMAMARLVRCWPGRPLRRASRARGWRLRPSSQEPGLQSREL